MKAIVLLTVILFGVFESLSACTNVIVTKGASTNNSNMIAYTCDGEFHPNFRKTPAMDYKPGEMMNIYNYSGKVIGQIKQVPHTYAVLGYHNMNEFQVAMGETTFGGRDELRDTTKFLNYWNLMYITLQRSKTAREAIQVMTQLVDEYGYGSSGESFSICDKNEAWLLEMIGPGTGGKGAQWVAIRIPDGAICAHANRSRIGEFPLDDPENCIYSENVISFAIEKGYYNLNSGEPFRFNEAYDPATPANLRYCETRVWSIFRRAAPSQMFSPDYHRGVKGAERYPLWINPDKKLSTADVMSLIRDHYEGTPFDMTKGVAAGAFGNPNRWRPLVWKIDSAEYTWERCISTYNTGFSIVTQSRDLPDELGVVWYGVDDSYFTCYAPVYVSTDTIHEAYNYGNIREFSMKSLWWVFNLVSNYANTKYSYVVKDIQKAQNEIEGLFFARQDSVENYAMSLLDKNQLQAKKMLSEYSLESMQYVFDKWTKLSGEIIAKYNDGYVKNKRGRAEGVGYPLEWRKDIVKGKESYLLPVWKENHTTKEPDNY